MQLTARKFKAFSYWKIIFIWFFVLLIGTGGYFYYRNYGIPTVKINGGDTQNGQNDTTQGQDTAGIENQNDDFTGITNDANALVNKQKEKAALINEKEAKDPSDKNQPFNILILGIDRRHANQTSWRTDVIQLLTLSQDRKHAVLTHIPRDVWAGNYKINGVYNLQGPDAIKDIINKITGQRPDRIIRVDFDAFVYAVDSAGGVTVNNPVGFTDEHYPNDRSGSEEVIKVSFPKGSQVLDGETALEYVRSRKGNNGQGSDYARGYRQQIVMQSIVADFFKPDNLFKPKTAETLYNIATKKVYTDISMKDTQILFEVMKGYKDIGIKNLSLDTSNYLMVPTDSSPYGGAWTLIPKTDYLPIHQAIDSMLMGNDPAPITSQAKTQGSNETDNTGIE